MRQGRASSTTNNAFSSTRPSQNRLRKCSSHDTRTFCAQTWAEATREKSVRWSPSSHNRTSSSWTSRQGREEPWQWDQMVRLFFNVWPFATLKISPIMSQICQSRLSILPNKKLIVKNLPKICKLLQKCQIFCQILSHWTLDSLSSPS